MSTFLVDKPFQIFLAFLAIPFSLIASAQSYEQGISIFLKLPLLFMIFLLPYVLSNFYRITINNEEINYHSPLSHWTIKVDQIDRVDLIPYRGASCAIRLATRNGNNREFEVTFFDRQEIWLALRENLQPYALHSKLPKTLLAGQPIEIDRKYKSLQKEGRDISSI